MASPYYTLWQSRVTKQMFVIETECVMVTDSSSIVYEDVSALQFYVLPHNDYKAIGSSNTNDAWKDYFQMTKKLKK